MSELSDNDFEQLMNLAANFTFGEIEESIQFDSYNDEQREEISKAVMKTIEISTVIISKLFPAEAYNRKLMDEIQSLVKEEKLEEVAALLNTN